MQKNVLIVGLGLIGSSLASCIKGAHPSCVLYGWDYLAETKATALKEGVVDRVSASFEEAACLADIIILAVPVKTSLTYLATLATLPLRENVLVTDTGSTKEEIVSFAIQQPYTFVGGHPMAGSHKSGIQARDERLFEEAYYILTPTQSTDSEQEIVLRELLKGTRAKFLSMSASEHDQITGMLSHFPHIVAAALVNQADHFNLTYPRSKQLAAGGFRDITRIASSDPQMWTDILLSNHDVLVERIDEWQARMSIVREWLIQGNTAAIYDFFERARDTRERLPIHQKGSIPAFYDLFIDIPDSPGIIGEVTSLLGTANLSLVNLRILETREEIIGVLQLSFKNQKDQCIGQQLITANTPYRCWIK